MRILAIIGAVTFALITGGVAFCTIAFPSYTHRYRLTVEAEIGGEVRSGSSVIEVTWGKQLGLGDAPSWGASIKGQAPLVDLGSHGVLLAPLVGGLDRPVVAADFLALRAFGHFPNRPRVFPPNAEGLRALSSFQGRAKLHPDNMPLLVWMPDPTDRMSARPVDPSELSSIIAPMILFRGAWIETTGGRITTDLATKLPWLSGQYRTERERGLRSRPGEYQLVAHAVNRGIDP